MAGIQKGTGTAGKEKVGKLTMAQVEQIAQNKIPELNTKDLEAAKRSVIGTAKSMGVEIVG
jgi:large subunit ribosomal protein L11